MKAAGSFGNRRLFAFQPPVLHQNHSKEDCRMSLDEIVISRAIIDRFARKFSQGLDVDVAVVGAGPSGLLAACYLARGKARVALFERKLSVGGGMWGGGMLFNEIVVQEKAKRILDEFGVTTEKFQEGYYTADSVETVSTLCASACRAGVKIFNGMSVEDLMVRKDAVAGLVINWTAVEMANLHVDPLAVRARYVVDATGHPAEVVQVLERKNGIKFGTPKGSFQGERSLWAEEAERSTLENTGEIYPGLYVAGMAVNATFGGYRMGPIFGGMLFSGEKVARMILERLGQTV
jgi:thiazole biosynthesis enzyme